MKFLTFISAAGFDKFIRMVVLLLCLALLGGLGWYCLKTGKPLDGVSMIVTALITVVLNIVNFDWGSSSGSKDKDNTISQMLNKKDQ